MNEKVRTCWPSLLHKAARHFDILRLQMNPESRQLLPKLAFNGFASRFKEPKVKEGFQDVVELDFVFRGTPEEYAIWGRYWV